MYCERECEKMKKICSILLAVILCMGAITGCGKADEEKKEGNDMGTHIVVDHFGNEVEVPNKIETVVTTSITPLPAVYCMFAGSAERLIGMSPSSKAAAENSILIDLFPELKNVSTSFMSGTEVNVEELLSLNPDVVFCNTSAPKEYEQLRQAGLSVVGVSTTQWGSDSIETFEGWIKLLGEVFNEQDKAEGITEYGRNVQNMIQTRIDGLKDEDKPSIMFLYKYSDGTIRIPGNAHFGQYWADATGAKHITNEIEANEMEVNMEQIYEWDPDMIYITNFAPYLAEDLFNNSAYENHDWSSVRAVKERNVYKCPLGVYRWYPPSSDTPLMLLWMAKNNHPELFGDIDLEQEMKDYYKKFYNINLMDEDVERIFNPTREAAGL